MSTLRKFSDDHARAELSTLQSLIDELPDDDVMSRIGLEARRNELSEYVQGLDERPEEISASAALFFGGKPVVASRGIESKFGGDALTVFQDLVSKLVAEGNGGLAQRGVVPGRDASTLHITNVVRGSFGFLLEEVQEQGQMVATALKDAVTTASGLLSAFAELDDESFKKEVETIDERVFATAGKFFSLMQSEAATFRLVAGGFDESFGVEAIGRAIERASTTRVEDVEEFEHGQLAGVLPDGHRFEFRTAGPRGLISGKVDKAYTPAQLADFNRTLVNTNARAKLKIRRMLRNEELERESFTLLELDPTPPRLPIESS